MLQSHSQWFCYEKFVFHKFWSIKNLHTTMHTFIYVLIPNMFYYFVFHYFQFHPWPHQHSQGVPCFLVICPLRLLVFLYRLLLVIRGILWQIISRPISLILDPCSNDKKTNIFFWYYIPCCCFFPSLQPLISFSILCLRKKKKQEK